MRLRISEKFLSLRHKIVVSFLLMILFSSTVIGFYSYYSAKSNIEDAVGDSALTIIKSIVDTVDGEKFKELKNKDNMQTQYYKDLQANLSNIRKETGLIYLYTMRKTENGKYVYVVDGTPMNDEKFSALGDEEENIDKTMEAAFGGVAGYGFNSDEWGKFISAFIPVKDKTGAVVGIMGADFDAESMLTHLNKLKMNIFVVIVVVILFAIFAGEALSVVLVRTLNKLKTHAEFVKDGDLTVKFSETGRDEVGILAQSFSEMVDNLLVIIKEIKNSTQNVANEIEDLHESISDNSTATEEIVHIISEIAEGTVVQTNSVQTVSDSMNEVFNQVKKSVSHAKSISELSNQAAVNARQAMEIFKASIEKVNNVNDTVAHTARIITELGEKSKEIGDFSDKISRITKQTSLLSLNAAIEAARAGEEGKGFRVVSDQIKALAEQTSEASKQISEITSTMQAEINNAIKSIQNGVVQANDGVSSVIKVDTFLAELQKSSNDSNSRINEIIESIYLIEEDCRTAVVKVNELAVISRSFSENSQQAVASTEEQTAVIQQIKDNINNVKNMTTNLSIVANKFKIE